MNILIFENKLKSKISNSIKELYDLDIEVELEKPNDLQNGNFSTNIALKLTKELKLNPLEIATSIKDNLSVCDKFERVEVAKPGFINFYMSNNFYSLILESIDNEFGTLDANDDKYLVEYVSANPTGDLHLGHARGAVYGDSLIKIMKTAGYNVDSEYYLNDFGSQMNNLGESVKHFYYQKLGLDYPLVEDGYKGKDIQHIASTLYEEYKEDAKDESLEFFVEYGYKINLQGIKDLMKDMNIVFDNWVSERELHSSGKVKDVLEVLKDSGDLYEEDGAMWLKTTKHHDEKDRVIQKKDGQFTYFASDIAYHIDKYNRGYDYLIDIWGADHHGYVPRVKSAIASLGKDANSFEVPIVQMVSVLDDGKAVKMSKRLGTSVTIKELLEQIDIDALRYIFVMRSLDTQLEFDIKIAKEKSMENPIYYIQYANARMSKVLKDIKALNIEDNIDLSNLSLLEQELIDKISIYPKVIKECAQKRLPHILANYIYDLASIFHKYYNQEKVFETNNINIKNKEYIYSKLYLVMKLALNNIGIESKEEM